MAGIFDGIAEAAGKVGGALEKEAASLKNLLDMQYKVADSIAVSEASSKLFLENNYFSDPKGQEKFIADVVKSTNISSPDKALTNVRGARVAALANDIFVKNATVYQKQIVDLTSNALNNSSNALRESISRGDMDLHSALESFSKDILPHVRRMVDFNVLSEPQLQEMARKAKADLLYAGIQTFPPEMQEAAIKEFGSDLSEVDKLVLTSNAKYGTYQDIVGSQIFMSKLVSGGFGSAQAAQNYIQKNGLPPAYQTAYSIVSRVRGLDAQELQDFITESGDKSLNKKIGEAWQTELNTHLSKDPIEFAFKTGLADVKPLVFEDLQNLPTQVAHRETIAKTLSAKYGVEITNVLTSQEKVQLGQLTANAKPSVVADVMSLLPPQSWESSGELDSSMFSGARWLASHTANHDSDGNIVIDGNSGNIKSVAAKVVAVEQMMAKNPQAKREVREVVLGDNLVSGLTSAFEFAPGLAQSAADAIRKYSFFNGKENVEYEKRNFIGFNVGTEKEVSEVLGGKFVRSRAYNATGADGKAFASSTVAEALLAGGVHDYITKYGKENAYPITGENMSVGNRFISKELVATNGRFVNLSTNEYGIQIVNRRGVAIFVAGDDGKPLRVKADSLGTPVGRKLTKEERDNIEAPIK